jgi:hypothetical protein
MEAVRIRPDLCLAAAGAPDYFRGQATSHSTAQARLHRSPTADCLYAGEFEKGGRDLRVRVHDRPYGDAPNALPIQPARQMHWYMENPL